MRHFGTPRPGGSWDIAGTEEYATEDAFNQRVARANARLQGGIKRSIYSNTKANRKAYGVESENAWFKLYDQADPDRVAKVLAQAAFLPMTVEVTP